MTKITTPTGAHNQPQAGIWHRTKHALGKLWATMIVSPDAPAGATRRKAPPSEYFNFLPF